MINGLKKIEKRISLWVKFTKLRLFFCCVFKDVIFIIKFEPTREFNFKNRYVLIDYNIVIILTNVD